jgi:hypothetical protein
MVLKMRKEYDPSKVDEFTSNMICKWRNECDGRFLVRRDFELCEDEHLLPIMRQTVLRWISRKRCKDRKTAAAQPQPSSPGQEHSSPSQVPPSRYEHNAEPGGAMDIDMKRPAAAHASPVLQLPSPGQEQPLPVQAPPDHCECNAGMVDAMDANAAHAPTVPPPSSPELESSFPGQETPLGWQATDIDSELEDFYDWYFSDNDASP